jgi:hypothetical protein
MKVLFSSRALLLLILLGIQTAGLFSEHIPVNKEMGWDGKNYGELTVWFEDLAKTKQIDSYQYQRVLTPAIIHYTCRMFHIPLSIETVPFIYGVYNFILLAAAALLFFAICTQLSIHRNIEVIGFAALFFNYFALKNTPYYPVLTDVSAFFMGMLLCYCFVKRSNIGMGITLLLGHFTFPLFLLSSLPLFVNIRTNAFTAKLNTALLFKILAAFFILVYLVVLTLMLTHPDLLLIPKYTMQINMYLLPVSIILVLVYMWRLLNTLGKAPIQKAEFNTQSLLLKMAGAFVFMIVCSYFIRSISIPEEVFTPKVFLMNVFQQSIDNPLVFLVSHTIYLGPAIILIVLFYKRFVNTLMQTGDSAIVYFLIAAVLSLGSETRQFLHFYPFMVIMLLLGINDLNVTRKQLIIFVLLSLVCSKCWLPINAPEIFEHYDFMNFPDQRYFMNHGPFMSDQSYFINLAIVSVSALIIIFLFRKTTVSAQVQYT